MWATEIKVRAERRAGEMLSSMEKNKGVRFDGRGPDGGFRQSHDENTQRLADVGVTPMQSHRWQQLASMTDEHFEAAVATAKDTAGQVTTAFMLREAQRAKPQPTPRRGAKADAIREELNAAKQRGVSMLETYARLTLRAVRSQDSFTEQERALLAELSEAIAAATA